MPLQSVEPMMLLSAVTVPGEVVVAVATGATAAFTAMGKAIQVLYKNGRQDSIDSISALKDSAHALADQAATLHKQTEILDKVAIYMQEEGKRRVAGG